VYSPLHIPDVGSGSGSFIGHPSSVVLGGTIGV
jgi:hypothetical protein